MGRCKDKKFVWAVFALLVIGTKPVSAMLGKARVPGGKVSASKEDAPEEGVTGLKDFFERLNQPESLTEKDSAPREKKSFQAAQAWTKTVPSSQSGQKKFIGSARPLPDLPWMQSKGESAAQWEPGKKPVTPPRGPVTMGRKSRPLPTPPKPKGIFQEQQPEQVRELEEAPPKERKVKELEASELSEIPSAPPPPLPPREKKEAVVPIQERLADLIAKRKEEIDAAAALKASDEEDQDGQAQAGDEGVVVTQPKDPEEVQEEQGEVQGEEEKDSDAEQEQQKKEEGGDEPEVENRGAPVPPPPPPKDWKPRQVAKDVEGDEPPAKTAPKKIPGPPRPDFLAQIRAGDFKLKETEVSQNEKQDEEQAEGILGVLIAAMGKRQKDSTTDETKSDDDDGWNDDDSDNKVPLARFEGEAKDDTKPVIVPPAVPKAQPTVPTALLPREGVNLQEQKSEVSISKDPVASQGPVIDFAAIMRRRSSIEDDDPDDEDLNMEDD